MRHLNHLGFLLSLLCAAFAMSSCEEIVDADGLPYEEKLVIHGILFAESSSSLIQISRTLPVNVMFDTNQAYLKNATGAISDGERSYPLEYVGYSGKYRAVGLVPQSGKTYSLDVSWGSLSATASTVVPAVSHIDTAFATLEISNWGLEDYFVTTKMLLPPGCSTQIDVMIRTDGTPLYTQDYRLYGQSSAKEDGFVYTKTNLYRSNASDPTSIWIRHHTFSPGYYEYRQSRGSDDFEELGNPAVIRWNVEGDAIGIFFGCAIGETTITF